MLSSGKGTWGQVNSLIKLGDWDKIYLICNDFAYENFDIDQTKTIKLKIDEKHPDKSIRILSQFFKKDIKDFEVGLNLISGSGLEHMAILSAILKAGLGVRLIYADMNEVKEFKISDEKYMPIPEDNILL